MGKKAEAFATDEHGKTRKQNTSFRAGCVSDGWARKHKHLPRKEEQEEAEALATDEHGITRKRQNQRHGKDRSRSTSIATELHGKTRK